MKDNMNPIEEWKRLQDTSFLYKAVMYDQEESYWSRYAENYDQRRTGGKGPEAELGLVNDLFDRDMTVLEIGAGTGIFTKYIAKKVKKVTVVEPSPSMIRVLKNNLDREHIKNVEIIQAKWEEVETEAHDVVFAAGCLYVFYEIEKALKKMIEKAERLLVLTHGINGYGETYREAAELMGIDPPSSGPDYRHLYNILFLMGIYANVHITKSRSEILYDDMNHAVSIWAERIGAMPGKLDRLQRYLENKLTKLPSGRFSMEGGERVNAIIWHTKDR